MAADDLAEQKGDRRSSPRALLGTSGSRFRRARSSGPPVIPSLPTMNSMRGVPGVNAEAHAAPSASRRQRSSGRSELADRKSRDRALEHECRLPTALVPQRGRAAPISRGKYAPFDTWIERPDAGGGIVAASTPSSPPWERYHARPRRRELRVAHVRRGGTRSRARADEPVPRGTRRASGRSRRCGR